MLQPIGLKLLVLPIQTENYKTESGLEIVGNILEEGEVVAVSDFLKDIYSKGDIIVYPKDSGSPYFYNGQNYKVLNGQEMPQGDVWFIKTKDNDTIQ